MWLKAGLGYLNPTQETKQARLRMVHPPPRGLQLHLTLAKVTQGSQVCIPEPGFILNQELGRQPLGKLWLCRLGRAGHSYLPLAEIPLK